MKLPIEWLNEYVSTQGVTPEELADKLVNVGFEVEEIIYTGAGIEKVVTGKILDIRKHPDADKLQICSVDVGNETVTIVTGAHNIATGDCIPVALDGATLPGDKHIAAAPLRGVMSYGMMCSGKELGVDDTVIAGAEVNGILILPPTPTGIDIKEILRLNDVILDISVTANRPDCQSIYGMAREVAAVLGRKLKPLDLRYAEVPAATKPTVAIRDTACSRYTCQIVENVKVAPSPQWMRDRLRRVGVRSVNNIVDITNYVLFEVGQPLHAFDLSQVADCGIIVRKAKEGEKITALDGNVYTLTDRMTVIADKDKSLAIAGVMGGEYSGICAETSAVLLESARFAKGNVRATSRALGLRSDSSARYEKGVDLLSVEVGRRRALALFSRLKAGQVTDAYAQDGESAREKVIGTSAKKISALLGIEVKKSVIASILKSLSFGVAASGDRLTVTVPLFREDVENYTDLAEEVIRYYGYENIRSTFMPTAKTTAGGADTRLRNLDTIKSLMCALGAYEIATFSFIGKKAVDKLNLPTNSDLRRQIEILNPLGEEYSLMRTQLAYSMLSAVSYNFSKKNKNFRLFELSKTYLADSLPLTDLPAEHDTLCFAFTGSGESFYTVKSAATELMRKFAIQPERTEYSAKPYYHPGVSCDCYLSGKVFCTFGKVHPSVAKNFDLSEDVYLCEMDCADFIGQECATGKFVPLPKFQPVERDLAVIVKDDVPVGDLIRAVSSAHPLCRHAELFDIYKGEQIERGYKSVALSFTLSSDEKTLNDEEITTAVKAVLTALETKFDAKLR